MEAKLDITNRYCPKFLFDNLKHQLWRHFFSLVVSMQWYYGSHDFFFDKTRLEYFSKKNFHPLQATKVCGLTPYWYFLIQFGCGILKMVGPKMQDFCPRIDMLKRNCFKTILQWIMVYQKVPKLYFQSQFSMSKIKGVFQKRKSFKNINLGDHFL